MHYVTAWRGAEATKQSIASFQVLNCITNILTKKMGVIAEYEILLDKKQEDSVIV